MGLLTGYQEDADRIARQEKTLLRGYNHDVRGLKAEAAPDEKIVKDYNAQVEGFKQSSLHNADGSIWTIAGYLNGSSAPSVARIVNFPDTPQFNGAPAAGSHLTYDNDGNWFKNDMYSGAGFNSQGGYGFMTYASNGLATLRNQDGTPVRAWQSSMDNVTPVVAYASRNDQPFVSPVTQSQIDTAKASDATLKDIGARGDAMRAETDVAKGLLSKKADRLEGDITMNKNAIANEAQPDIGGSVFDQTKVFQSITDWLKG